MAAETDLIPVVIEEARGGSGRHRVDRATGLVERTGDMPPRWPAHYGCVPGTLSPADGDMCDCVVLGDRPVVPGRTVLARPVGIMRRDDLDDKILAVLPDDPRFGAARDIADIPVEVLEEFTAALRPYFRLGPWEGVASARAFIASCRAAE